jgi:ankyrin repeat protein
MQENTDIILAIDLKRLDEAKSIAHAAALNSSWVTEAFLSCFPTDLEKRARLINQQDSTGRSALFYACFHGNYESAALLLSAGASVSLMDWRFRTPLHYAAASDNYKLIDLLFLNGADRQVEEYRDPMDKAKSIKDALNQVDTEDFLESLRRPGFTEDEAQVIYESFYEEINPKNKEASIKAVHIKMDWIDFVKPSADAFEIETPKLSLCINFKDKLGRTPLHLAVYFGNVEVVEILMFLKAD